MKPDYATTYREWVASLPPDRRAELKAQSLDEPCCESYVVLRPDQTGLLERMSIDFDYGAFDTPHKGMETDSQTDEDPVTCHVVRVLAWVVAHLQDSRTTRDALIDFDALVFSLGMDFLGGRTGTDIAQSYGITRAAFSARVKKWQKLLKMRPSSLMKTEKACRAYKASAKARQPITA